MKYQLKIAVFAAICLTMSVFSSCSKNDDNTPKDNTPKGPSVKVVTSATFGKVLTDSLGQTLYFFTPDADGKSVCSGPCIVAWPVFYKEHLTIDTLLAAADFGLITRTDGTKQNTYKGWPLYYYQHDNKAGDINGDAADSTWFVAKPDYTVMLVNAQLVGKDSVNYTSELKPGTGFTQFITDDYGRTLYGFKFDKNGANAYTKPDFSNDAVWPIYQVTDIRNVPSILDKTAFTTLTVFGKTQLAYKGWPLYYFGADEQKRGNTKGVSVPSPGVWPIVNLNTTVAPLP